MRYFQILETFFNIIVSTPYSTKLLPTLDNSRMQLANERLTSEVIMIVFIRWLRTLIYDIDCGWGFFGRILELRDLSFPK